MTTVRFVPVVLAGRGETAFFGVLQALSQATASWEEIVVVHSVDEERIAKVADEAGATLLGLSNYTQESAYLSAMEYLATVLAPSPLSLDVVLFLDDSSSQVPADYDQLVSPIEKREVDFSIGISRGRMGLGACLFHAAVWLICGEKIREIPRMSAITYLALVDLKLPELRAPSQLELLLRALRAGFRYRAVEVQTPARGGGLMRRVREAGSTVRSLMYHLTREI